MLFFYDKPGFDEGLGTFLLTPAMMGVLVLIYFAIGVVLAIWVYSNAKKRNMKSRDWLIAVILSGFIGFLVYLTIRDPMHHQ